MTLPRLLTAALVAGLSCLLAVAAAWQPGRESPARVAVEPAADRTTSLAVLREWDRDRSEAWRRGSPQALARLYVAGSAAGRADRALLAAYAERGLRVTGVVLQRAAVEVESATAGRAVLLTTDRLAGATAVGPQGTVPLPRDGWSRHRIVLRQVGGRWRVAALQEVSGGRRPARP